MLQEIGFPNDVLNPSDEALSVELTYRLTEKRCLLVLDQLEAVQNANDRGSFEKFLQSWQQRELGRSSVMVVTTRLSFGLGAIDQVALTGLTEAEGARFLTSQSITTDVARGLEQLTQQATGHPMSLDLAASWLRQEAQGCLRETDLEFFRQLFQHYQGDSEAQVGSIFAKLFAELPERLRSLLLGVVVYRDAFGLEAAQAMVSDATIEDLRSLSGQAFLRGESERWTLHPLMQNLVEQELQASERYRESHERAIGYFTLKIKPSAESIADCAEELELFHHCCELKEYALANQIMDTCVNFLDRRGYYRTLLPIYQQLTDAWTIEHPADPDEQRNLGWAWTRLGGLYRSLGQYPRAIEFYQESLETMRNIGDYNGEAKVLGNLGTAYRSLGQYPQAIEFYQQSLGMMRNIGDRNGEANSLWNLSNIYQQRGQFKRSRSYRHQTYRIWQELKLPLEALPFPEFQKRLLQNLGDDWIEQQLENEQRFTWFIDALSLIVFLIRGLFSPIRWMQRQLRPQK